MKGVRNKLKTTTVPRWCESKIIEVLWPKTYFVWSRSCGVESVTNWSPHGAHDNPALSHEVHVNLTIRMRIWCEPLDFFYSVLSSTSFNEQPVSIVKVYPANIFLNE